jgi:hypothetical protein
MSEHCPSRCGRRQCATVADGIKCPADARAVRGRTQWDAMAEVTSHGKWNASRMALLIFVRYGPRSAVGAGLVEVAIRLVETLGHLH